MPPNRARTSAAPVTTPPYLTQRGTRLWLTNSSTSCGGTSGSRCLYRTVIFLTSSSPDALTYFNAGAGSVFQLAVTPIRPILCETRALLARGGSHVAAGCLPVWFTYRRPLLAAQAVRSPYVHNHQRRAGGRRCRPRAP